MAVNLHQTKFRFGIDELAESTHGWLAAENTNASRLPNSTFLLRFTVQETGGTAAANVDNQFQYNRNGAGWNDITTTSAVVKAVAAAAFANGANCTKRLTGTGTFESTGAGCTEDGSSGGTANDIAASGNSETECGLQVVGADVARGDTIQFRLTSPDFPITVDVTPTLTVLGAVVLAAGAGSIALTGIDLTLRGTKRMSAVAGGYSETGAAATLRKGYPLATQAGGYSVTGAVADLAYTPNAGQTLDADAGAVTLTGATAGTRRGYGLTAGAQAFSVAGQSAALKVGRRAVAGLGGVQAIGAAANATVARLLAASAGNPIVVGAEPSLNVVRRLEAEGASATVSGSQVAFSVGVAVVHVCRAGRGDFGAMGGETHFSISPLWPQPDQVLYGVKYGSTGCWKTGTNRNMGRRR